MIYKGTQPIQQIYFGSKRISQVYRGSNLVWAEMEEAFLEVKPTYIFLMPSNNFTDDVNVIANVEWNVK